MSSLGERISSFWDRVNGSLFPELEDADVEMTPKLYKLVALMDFLQVELFVPARSPYLVGAKPHDRRCLVRAYLAKAFYHATDNKAFRDRLLHDKDLRKVCGWANRWDVPSESTFSRAFAWFADLGLTDQILAAQVQVWLGADLLRDVSTDSTAIEAREKPVTRAKPPTDAALEAAAPVGTVRAEVATILAELSLPEQTPATPQATTPQKTTQKMANKPSKQAAKQQAFAKAYSPVEPTRLERQLDQVPEIALLELDTACDVGCKTNSQGKKNYWIGYKFHVRVAEGNLPLLAFTTSASVHDSQVDIPLMKMTDRLVTSLYELKDRAYDAQCIRLASERAGHVPIIDYI